MALTKQAKVLTDAQVRSVLSHVASTRYPKRDRVMVLLSLKAGMRAIEIAALTWAMVTDAEGELTTEIRLPNSASKGSGGGRVIPMHGELATALAQLRDGQPAAAAVIKSERGKCFSAAGVVQWFFHLYATLGLSGASSHSGRRTFITRAARKITEAGGSLRDVQDIAGHASIATTQKYIQISESAKRKVVDLI